MPRPARSEAAHAARIHADISPSGADRWWNCPGSVELIAALQEAGTIPKEDVSSHAANEGTAAHELLEMSLKAGRAPVSFVGRKVHEGIEVDHEMAGNVEEAIDYIARFRTPGDLLFTEEELEIPCTGQPGHVDVARVCKDYLDVFDYKNGVHPVYAKLNKQGMLYACGVVHKLRKQKHAFLKTIKKVRIHIIQPNSRDRVPAVPYELTLAQLDDFAQEVSDRVRAIRVGGQPRVPGDKQCFHCKAKAHCKELARAAVRAAQQDWDTVMARKASFPKDAAMSIQELAAALDALPLVELWLDAVRGAAANAIAKGKAVPGYKLVEGQSRRKWADEVKVMAALAKMKIPLDNYAPRKLAGLGVVETLLKKDVREKFFKQHTIKPRGNPTLAPETDPRPHYSHAERAKADFAEDLL